MLEANNLAGKDKKFYELFVEYVEILSEYSTTGQERREYAREIGDQLTNTITDGDVSRAVVIMTFSEMLKKYPDHTFALVQFMWHIAGTYKYQSRNPFPEFFWLALNSGILSQVRMYDLAWWLSDMVNDRELSRAYLIAMLFEKEVANDPSGLRDIVHAFYYAGHTADTLKTFTEILPLEDSNIDLYNYTYGVALGMLFSERATTLTDEDKKFLRAFFRRGLDYETSHPRMVEDCRKALAQLDAI